MGGGQSRSQSPKRADAFDADACVPAFTSPESRRPDRMASCLINVGERKVSTAPVRRHNYESSPTIPTRSMSLQYTRRDSPPFNFGATAEGFETEDFDARSPTWKCHAERGGQDPGLFITLPGSAEAGRAPRVPAGRPRMARQHSEQQRGRRWPRRMTLNEIHLMRSQGESDSSAEPQGWLGSPPFRRQQLAALISPVSEQLPELGPSSSASSLPSCSSHGSSRGEQQGLGLLPPGMSITRIVSLKLASAARRRTQPA